MPRSRKPIPLWQFEALARLAKVGVGSRAYQVARYYYVDCITWREVSEAFGGVGGDLKNAIAKIRTVQQALDGDSKDISLARGKFESTVPQTGFHNIWR
ncbi:hypothetical protein ACLS0R_14600 [Comamonas jiangduensis]|uniref:hypothetical protein n=1 Tax=Comamonas jiangduensis TaxID=1194168 RepID=UPI003BF877E5